MFGVQNNQNSQTTFIHMYICIVLPTRTTEVKLELKYVAKIPERIEALNLHLVSVAGQIELMTVA